MTRQRGFSLIELAIVLVIGTILLTAGLRLLTSQSDSAAYSATKKHQQAITDALASYLGKFNRLPCPDTNVAPLVPDGTEKRNGGTPSACQANFGVVPYATLGLTRDVALDSWDNFISYGVSQQWTLTYNSAAPANTPQTANALNAFNVGNTGALTVNDRVPATNAVPTPITAAAVVVLISYGKDGSGAITLKGTQNALPAAGTDELTNVNVGAAGTIYYKREYTDTNVPTYGAFDDAVLVLQSGDLITPLTKDGSLRSPAGTLNQTFAALSNLIVSYAIQKRTGASSPYNYVLPGNSFGGGFFNSNDFNTAGIPVDPTIPVTPVDPWGSKIQISTSVPSGSSCTTILGATPPIITLTSNGPPGGTLINYNVPLQSVLAQLPGGC